MTAGVHLIVPIKPLHLAKSRLLGAAPRTPEHADLVAALALDTVTAAQRATGVCGVTVVTSDPTLTEMFNGDVEVLPDSPDDGLNAALRHAEARLRRCCSTASVGALQADLPALRPDELSAALKAADNHRAFCPDRQGTGTTLLLAEPGRPLDPLFGPGSAAEHLASGAKLLDGPWESLRCDVDTANDLKYAARLGLGPRSSAASAHLLRDRPMTSSVPPPRGRTMRPG